MVQQYLECQEGGSDKFYEITQTGCDVVSRYGKTGSDGQRTIKSFGSEAEAKKFLDKTVAEKVKKGYVHKSGSAGGAEKASGKRKAEEESAPAKKAKAAPASKGKGKKKDEDEDEDEGDEDGGNAGGKKYWMLECIEGTANKFYEVRVTGSEVSTRYGRIGTDGSASSKTYKNAAEAMKNALKTVAEKTKKGYEEVADEGEDEEGRDEDGEGEDEEDDESEADKNDGADVDLTSDTLDLPEPMYKKAFLKKIIKKASQFKTLSACGDWEAFLSDLKYILPHLKSLTTVILEIPQSGCGGVDEIVALVAKLPLVEALDLGNSYEGESMEPLKDMLRKHPKLQNLSVCFEQGNEEDIEGVIQAIYDGISSGVSKLTEFEGAALNEYLELLHITDESFADKSNAEILKQVRAQKGKGKK